MKTRFEGDKGRERLLEAMLRQFPVRGNLQVAERLVDKATLFEFAKGDKLIQQGDIDVDIFFIVHGKVDIVVNGRVVAQREATQHVGEMSLIDPLGVRSATVIADEVTVAAKISEEDMSAIANEYPIIWRLFAVEIVDRFRQRGTSIKTPNAEPRVFLGSSSEGLKIAEGLQAGLSHAHCTVEIWSQNVFTASNGTMEVLENKTVHSDFAIFVLTPDDMAEVRGTEYSIPRDNVIFEIGLFMGAIGRKRTFMVAPRNVDLKIPSDLLGITLLPYKDGNLSDLSANLGPVCTAIKTLIEEQGPK